VSWKTLNIVIIPNQGTYDCPFGGSVCQVWNVIDERAIVDHLDDKHFDIVAFKELNLAVATGVSS
jgi:hypothetical protein